MSVLREASAMDVSEALTEDREPREPDELADALEVLRLWFEDLPADRTDPDMTFSEFTRLLYDALQPGE